MRCRSVASDRWQIVVTHGILDPMGTQTCQKETRAKDETSNRCRQRTMLRDMLNSKCLSIVAFCLASSIPTPCRADWVTNARPGGEVAMVVMVFGLPFYLLIDWVSVAASKYPRPALGDRLMAVIGIPIICWLGTMFSLVNVPVSLIEVTLLVGILSSWFCPRLFLAVVFRGQPIEELEQRGPDHHDSGQE